MQYFSKSGKIWLTNEKQKKKLQWSEKKSGSVRNSWGQWRDHIDAPRPAESLWEGLSVRGICQACVHVPLENLGACVRAMALQSSSFIPWAAAALPQIPLCDGHSPKWHRRGLHQLARRRAPRLPHKPRCKGQCTSLCMSSLREHQSFGSMEPRTAHMKAACRSGLRTLGSNDSHRRGEEGARGTHPKFLSCKLCACPCERKHVPLGWRICY